jgi:hypothetical protein
VRWPGNFTLVPLNDAGDPFLELVVDALPTWPATSIAIPGAGLNTEPLDELAEMLTKLREEAGGHRVPEERVSGFLESWDNNRGGPLFLRFEDKFCFIVHSCATTAFARLARDMRSVFIGATPPDAMASDTATKVLPVPTAAVTKSALP